MKRKIFNFILMAITSISFNKISSMELSQPEEKSLLLDLPYEIIDQILYQLSKSHIDLLLEKIIADQDIFDLDSQELKNLEIEVKKNILEQLRELAQVSRQMRVYALDFKKKAIRMIKLEKDKRKKELIENIKKEYANSTEDINLRLKKTLDGILPSNSEKDRRLLLQESAKLIIAGASPDLQDNCGWTPLMLAIEEGYLAIVQILLEKGANPDIYNNYGQTALMIATASEYKDIVQILLEKGANPDLLNNQGRTALMRATVSEYKDIVQILLEKGANPDIQDHAGCTALMIARRMRYEDIVELINKNKASKN